MRKARKQSGIPLIAELAEVSIGTVDRALHHRPGISPKTLKRILQIARQIGYKPNPAARALSTGRHVRIGICVPKEIAYFYDELWDGLRAEARRYASRGVELLAVAVSELGRGERSAFMKLLKAELSGIIVTPGNPEAMTPLIDTAEQRGTRVVCVSTDAPVSRRSSVVAIEPRLNGLIAGELMANFVGSKSKVAVLTGMLTTVDHSQKTEGFLASFRLRSAGGEVVAIIEAHEHPRESLRKTRHLLDSHPDLTGIYVNTVNCLPVCKAIVEARLTGKVRLITTDLFREMIPYFERGTIAASIHQQPYTQGELAFRTLAEHLLDQGELPRAQFLNPSIILRANLHLFREARAGGWESRSKSIHQV